MKATKNLKILLFIGSALFLGYFLYPKISRPRAIATTEKPNVVIISVDTMAAGHLGVYGNKTSSTPNIDDLAKKSTVFENAYTPIPWTNGSYGALFTGLYTGKIFDGGKIEKDTKLLAEELQNSRYRTAGYFSTPNLNDKVNGFGRGFDIYEEADITKTIDGIDDSYSPKAQRDMDTIQKSNNWMGNNKNNRMFLFTHLFAPHMPYDAPEPFKSKYSNELVGDFTRIKAILKNNEAADLNSYNLSEQEILYLEARYNEEIAYADSLVGKIIKQINDQGIADKTIIIITADHGESFDHDYLHHTQRLHESSIKIPLIVFDPKNMNNRRVAEPVSLIDVLPTLDNRLGLDINSKLDGVNLMPLINGDAIKRNVIFSMTMPPYLFEGKVENSITMKKNNYIGQQYAAINNDQRLIYNLNTGDKELYNIKDDPDQNNNLYLDEKYADILENNDLFTRLVLWLEQNQTLKSRDIKIKNDELYKSMKSLGYL